MDDPKPDDRQPPPEPGPSGWERKQVDIGAAMFLGGAVLIVLLVILILHGLF